MASTIEWSLTPAESRLLRLPVYAFVGALGGLLLIVVAGGVFALARAALAGDLLPIALVALLALVGGPISVWYLWPAIRDPGQRPALPDDLPRLSRLHTAVAVLAGAAAIPASTLISAFGPIVVLAVGLGSPILVPFFGSRGRADPDGSDGGRLTVNDRDVPLATLTEVRTVDLGSVVGFWLRYADAPLGAPRWLVVPAAVAPSLESVLERGVEAPPPERDPHSLALRLTLAVFGIGCFTAAGVLWWTGARYVGSWLVFLPGIALAVLFGGLFGRLAIRR